MGLRGGYTPQEEGDMSRVLAIIRNRCDIDPYSRDSSPEYTESMECNGGHISLLRTPGGGYDYYKDSALGGWNWSSDYIKVLKRRE